MPRSYSAAHHKKTNATGADETPIFLLEISHADLSVPVRVVNDNQDVPHLGNVFTAVGFRAVLPDDMEQGLPRARLAVDNVGRLLTDWIEASDGGQGATCRIIQILRSAPDTIEWDITLNLSDVKMDMLEVSAGLGYEDILNRPAVVLTHRPDTTPGLF